MSRILVEKRVWIFSASRISKSKNRAIFGLKKRKNVPSRDDSRLLTVVRRHLTVTKSLPFPVRRLQKIVSYLLFCTFLGVFLGLKKPSRLKTLSLSVNYNNPLRIAYLRPK